MAQGPGWGGGNRNFGGGRPYRRQPRKGHQQMAKGMISQIGPGAVMPGRRVGPPGGHQVPRPVGKPPGHQVPRRVGPGAGPGRRVGPGSVIPPGPTGPPIRYGFPKPTATTAPNPQRYLKGKSKSDITAFMMLHKGEGKFKGLKPWMPPRPGRP